ncbi:MAG: hypothetical protein KAF40_03370 [Flavihumibacter sp.]|nr:hypothetical protein [Flavihumibacter sp.]
MKRFIFFALMVLSLAGYSQSWKGNNLDARITFYAPERDTTGWTPYRNGAFLINPIDGRFYWWWNGAWRTSIADIPDASFTVSGKINLSKQVFSGSKLATALGVHAANGAGYADRLLIQKGFANPPYLAFILEYRGLSAAGNNGFVHSFLTDDNPGNVHVGLLESAQRVIIGTETHAYGTGLLPANQLDWRYSYRLAVRGQGAMLLPIAKGSDLTLYNFQPGRTRDTAIFFFDRDSLAPGFSAGEEAGQAFETVASRKWVRENFGIGAIPDANQNTAGKVTTTSQTLGRGTKYIGSIVTGPSLDSLGGSGLYTFPTVDRNSSQLLYAGYDPINYLGYSFVGLFSGSNVNTSGSGFKNGLHISGYNSVNPYGAFGTLGGFINDWNLKWTPKTIEIADKSFSDSVDAFFRGKRGIALPKGTVSERALDNIPGTFRYETGAKRPEVRNDTGYRYLAYLDEIGSAIDSQAVADIVDSVLAAKPVKNINFDYPAEYVDSIDENNTDVRGAQYVADILEMPSGTIKGNNTGSTGQPVNLTPSQTRSLLNLKYADWDIYEDFYTGYLSGNFLLSNGGTGALATSTDIQAVDQRGMLRLTTGSTATGYAVMSTTDNSLTFGATDLTMDIKDVTINAINNGTDSAAYMVGFFDNLFSNGNPADGAYIAYVQTESTWRCVTVSNGTQTVTASTVNVGTGNANSIDVEIRANSTQVLFYINGVLQATHTTNIPSGITRLFSMGVAAKKKVGTTARTMDIDRILFKIGN